MINAFYLTVDSSQRHQFMAYFIYCQESFYAKEAALAEATRQARQELHTKGSPYFVGDTKGTYAVYPDGRRVFMPNR
jgi:hypothetical protein